MPTLVERAVRKVLRLGLPVYYRTLGGRRYAGAARLERAVAALEARSGRGDVPLSKEAWEHQYGEGVWEVLHEPGEVARYGAVAGFVHRLAPGGRILDVGCGEGLLADHLCGAGGGGEALRYTGIDLSTRAVMRAGERRSGSGLRFLAADAESWEPPGLFDAVVFNECLYYFHRPLETAERYLEHLAPDGILVLSNYRTPRTTALLRRLHRRIPPRGEILLSGGRGTWLLSVHRRTGGPRGLQCPDPVP